MNPPRADPRPVLHETLPLDLPDTSAPLHRQETLMSFAYVLSTLRRRWLVVLLTMLAPWAARATQSSHPTATTPPPAWWSRQ